MKKLAILGSTGSVGTQALDVIRNTSGFSVEALTCDRNISRLSSQIEEFKPKFVCVTDSAAFDEAHKLIGQGVQLFNDLEELIDASSADLMINSLVGSSGLTPTMCAIKKGMDIALANKETLVCAGALVMEEARLRDVRIIPVDSEHSAIFQCLQGNVRGDLTKIHLTCSGGPFRTWESEKLHNITLEDALKHPNYSMGKKITIDSATLMNKGLEMIEAKWLFDVSMDDINVIIHPESIIHSAVEFRDGAVLAQLGTPDMRGPVAYALTYPDRAELDIKRLDFFEFSQLNFERPRYEDFPALTLCKEAMRIGGTMPAVLNAANEAAVALFLRGKIKFLDIPLIIEKAMAAYTYRGNYCSVGEARKPVFERLTISDVLEADAFGKQYVYEVTGCL